ncbi:MAG: tetratricopeptide repeat protein [Candidatus Aminicenantes bacterium]|nr:tetratricopeptide repeat protein [Candidatus Aminicenantes bacterium]
MNRKRVFVSAVLLVMAASLLFSGLVKQESAKELFERAVYLQETRGDLEGAMEVFQRIIQDFPKEREIASRAQLQIGICMEKLGFEEAEKAFQKVVDNFPDQTEAVKLAREKLSILQRARAVLEKDSEEFSLKRINASADVDAYDVSPDGRYVSYTDWIGGLLGVYEVATGKKWYLDKEGSELVLGSCFSPNGKWIAYNAYNEGSFWDLRIIDFEGKEPRVLYKNKDFLIYPVGWSPDGKSVLVGLAKTEDQQMSDTRIALVSIDDGAVNTL